MKYAKIEDDDIIYMKVKSYHKSGIKDYVIVTGTSVTIFDDNSISFMVEDEQCITPNCIKTITEKEYNDKVKEVIKILQNEVQKID